MSIAEHGDQKHELMRAVSLSLVLPVARGKSDAKAGVGRRAIGRGVGGGCGVEGQTLADTGTAHDGKDNVTLLSTKGNVCWMVRH